ncbi:MAG TPA: F0F1 ATP synthase subunit B [Candidatus Limnocylindrales bacterium]|nr:F0F1 ATP synthase subunit B [Candidatus Limnocylindrales bacterium]
MPILALIGGVPFAPPLRLAAESGPGLVFNGFWIAIAAVNFLFFLYVIQRVSFGPVSKLLADRRARIEQGLKDAEQARADRENAEQERLATLSEARREANDILARAQMVAQETRDADIAATREELERLRARASEEIAAEKHRALAELRSEVADLALQAAGAVVKETMTGDRQRRLVEDFLAESGSSKAN